MRTIHIKSWVFLLNLFILAGCGSSPFTPEVTPTEEVCHFLPPADPNYRPAYDPPISVDELINAAWKAGEISDGERVVYFAYALAEAKSLPERFIGNRLVDGTSTAIEIGQLVQDPDVMCQLKQCEQDEIRRVLQMGAVCNN